MKKRLRKRRLLLIVMVLFGLMLIGGGLFYSYSTKHYGGDVARLYIPFGTSSAALRDSLESALGDNYGARVFYLWQMMSENDSVRSGSYVVKHGEEAWRLARRINNRQQDPVKVSFHDVRLWDDFTARIAAQMDFEKERFADVADSLLQSRGIKRAWYPAMFFPDTYEFYWTDSPARVVNKMLANYDAFWSDERRSKALKMGLTPVQVATVASIVEEESNKTDERPVIARLYLNRLNRGMKLEADPTVKFAVGDFSLRRILHKHLSCSSPYNTYRHAGLPPGPIRFPQAATIRQVLDAPDNDYIYMCAKEDFSGYHNFTSNYSVHLENAARFRRALDARGIK